MAKLPTIYLATRDSQQSNQINGALDRRFNICMYTDTRYMIDAMVTDQPKVVIISAKLPANGGYKMLEIKQANPSTRHIPGILIGSSPDEFNSMPESQRNNFFVGEPINHDVLVRTILEAMSIAVEDNWQKLADGPRSALNATASEFKSVTNAVANNETIDYGNCEKSCVVLDKAVENGDTKNILDALKAHHNYAFVQSMRVATLLSLFGHGIGLRGKELHVLSTAGLLHDIGKLQVSDKLLSKSGKLSPDEWKLLQKHVQNTVSLLEKVNSAPKSVMMIAGQHHERLDGTGYPNGLRGKDINNLVRMAIITDIFGALTDKRSYRGAMSNEKAFDILTDMGPALDQKLVSLFREILTAI